MAPEKDTVRVNERIRVREVRVIGSDAEQLGVMTPEDALVLAREEGLDLVEVAANSRPPVCRIMDYGRYKYEQQKKKKSKQSHAASLKEVKMRPGTDQHDLNFKLGKVRKFLLEGDKVKITVMFRGREMVHTDRGRKQLKVVMEQLGALAKMENPPRMEGRFMSMIVVGEREAIAELKKNQEAEAEAGSQADAAESDAETSEETKSAAAAEVEATETEETVEADETDEDPEKRDASEAAVEDGQG